MKKITTLLIAILFAGLLNAQVEEGENNSTKVVSRGTGNTTYGNPVGTDGSHNSYFGYNIATNPSSSSLSTSNYNSIVGSYSGYSISGGTQNTFMGYKSGYQTTTGNNNAFYGAYSGNNNSSGSGNSFFGRNAGYRNSNGTYNLAMGYYSGYYNVEGDYNITLGYRAGYKILGDNNIILGKNAGFNATGSNNIFIGKEAGYSESGNDKLYIENSQSSTPLIYGDFNNELVTINGKLGVGGNPSSKFHVYAGEIAGGSHGAIINADLTDVILSHTLALQSETPYTSIGFGITNQAKILATKKGNGNNGKLEFFTNGTTGLIPNLTINDDGNVAVGYDEPTAKLHVAGLNSTEHHFLKITNNATGHGANDGIDIGILHGFLPVIRCQESAGLNFLAGTEGSESSLSLGANMLHTNVKFRITGSLGHTEVHDHKLIFSRDGWNYIQATDPDGGLILATGGSASSNNRLVINANGEVGINTNQTFGYQLAVNGTIGCKEVNIETTSAWPDYVFEEEYKLQDLKTIENFIKEKKHLPGVPSSKAVAENGINVAEMNAILLKKIEEMTLHMIQMQKEIEQLKANQ